MPTPTQLGLTLLVATGLAAAGCARSMPTAQATEARAAPPPAEQTVRRSSPICYDCFWNDQDPAFRKELVDFYEAYRCADPFVETDIQYLLGRVTGDGDRVCRSLHELDELREGLTDARRTLLADEMLAFTAAECEEDAVPYFRRASRSAERLGLDWKARAYEGLADGRFRPRFGTTEIERRLDVPEGATTFVLGRSAIHVGPGTRIGVQMERTVRDWLSYQVRYDFSDRSPTADELLD